MQKSLRIWSSVKLSWVRRCSRNKFVSRPVKLSMLTGLIARTGTFVNQLSVTDEGMSTKYWLTT